MAKEDADILCSRLKRDTKIEKETVYCSGREAGIQPRGNILLGQEKYITSLKPKWYRRILFKILF